MSEEEDEFDKDFELLESMTWDDTIINKEYEQLKENCNENENESNNSSEIDEEEERNEKELLEELVQQLKELNTIENNSSQVEFKDHCNLNLLDRNNEEINLVSVSKHATLEISWNMLNNWDQKCQEVKNNEANT